MKSTILNDLKQTCMTHTLRLANPSEKEAGVATVLRDAGALPTLQDRYGIDAEVMSANIKSVL